jgi:hypothetical protein
MATVYCMLYTVYPPDNKGGGREVLDWPRQKDP